MIADSGTEYFAWKVILAVCTTLSSTAKLPFESGWRFVNWNWLDSFALGVLKLNHWIDCWDIFVHHHDGHVHHMPCK